MEPRVPETRAARAVLYAALLALAALPWLPPRPAGSLVLARDDATCRLAQAFVSAPRCACEEMPVDVRETLGLPTALNRARAAELEGVPGLGPARAAAIAAERARDGDFTSLEALRARVPGIGAKTIDRIRPHLFAVGPDPACGLGSPS